MPKSILVTNDDGVESSLLSYLLEGLANTFPDSELRPVVPMEEKSWISQAVTRFSTFEIKPWSWDIGSERPVKGFIVDGTPADCASLGLFNLYSSPADLVISGINFGGNAGLPFYLYSGTVGAARAAFIAGTKSIAISAKLPSDVMYAWNHRDLDFLANCEQGLINVAKEASKVSASLMASSIFDEVDFINLNIPYELNDNPKLVFTHIERLNLGEMYQEVEKNRFQHHLVGINVNPSNSGLDRRKIDRVRVDERLAEFPDESTILQGDISITGVRYELGAKVSKDLESQINETYSKL